MPLTRAERLQEDAGSTSSFSSLKVSFKSSIASASVTVTTLSTKVLTLFKVFSVTFVAPKLVAIEVIDGIPTIFQL